MTNASRCDVKKPNLFLNKAKIKEFIVDFRRNETGIKPLSINRVYVERVSVFRFLRIHIEADLSWAANTSELVKKAQERLYFLRVLRKKTISKRDC